MIVDRHPPPEDGNGKPTEVSRGRLQFGLATLFAVTAVFAVASAGYAKGSIRGAGLALLGAWTTLIGGLLIWGALVRRPRMSLLGLLVGLGYLLFGATMWMWAVF